MEEAEAGDGEGEGNRGRRGKWEQRQITREIREASSPTMRGHFGCIFKGTEEYTTGVWWAFYMRIMCTKQCPLCDLGGEKKIRATLRMVMAMAMCGFMRG